MTSFPQRAPNLLVPQYVRQVARVQHQQQQPILAKPQAFLVDPAKHKPVTLTKEQVEARLGPGYAASVRRQPEPISTTTATASRGSANGGGGGRGCHLHSIPSCEWCALGVKHRNMYGRSWPYAEHPLTREHYCLEPVESPSGGLFPCCSFRREKPIKTSQGYAGHLASHRPSTSGNNVGNPATTPIGQAGMTNPATAGVGGTNDPTTKLTRLKRESALGSPYGGEQLPQQSDAPSPPTSTLLVGLLPSTYGGKSIFRASLQPSLPRCDLLAKGHLRFFLLPHDSEAEAVNVVFKGHRGKLTKRALKDDDGIFVVQCPLITELLPPNDTRTTFEVSVRVEDLAQGRRLFQLALLFQSVEPTAVQQPIEQQRMEAGAHPAAAIGQTSDDPSVSPMDPTSLVSSAENLEPREDDDPSLAVEYTLEEHDEPQHKHKHEHEHGQDMKRKREQTSLHQEPTDDRHDRDYHRMEEEAEENENRDELQIADEYDEERKETMEEAMEERKDGEGLIREEEEEEEEEYNTDDDESQRREQEERKRREADRERTFDGEEAERARKRSRLEPQSQSQYRPQPQTHSQPQTQAAEVTIKTEKMEEQQQQQQQAVPAATSAVVVPQAQSQSQALPFESMLAQLAEAAIATETRNVKGGKGGAVKGGTSAVGYRPTMAEALHALPLNTVSSLMPWASSQAITAAAAAAYEQAAAAMMIPNIFAAAAAAAAAAGQSCFPHPTSVLSQAPPPPGLALPPANKIKREGPPAPTSSSPTNTTTQTTTTATIAIASPPVSPPIGALTPTPKKSANAKEGPKGQQGGDRCRFYFYTVLPEKGKLIWVVFFSDRPHTLEHYELLLHEITQPAPISSSSSSSSSSSFSSSPTTDGDNNINNNYNDDNSKNIDDDDCNSSASTSLQHSTEMPPLSPPPQVSSTSKRFLSHVLQSVTDLAWVAEGTDRETGERLYQHKVCFQAPDSTFERRIFSATLHHRVDRTATLLGGLSLVSTTSQREHMWPRINQWFPNEAQQMLVRNCRNHPPSRRHFLNGKGSRQGSKQSQKDRFLVDELEKSVELETVQTASSSAI